MFVIHIVRSLEAQWLVARLAPQLSDVPKESFPSFHSCHLHCKDSPGNHYHSWSQDGHLVPRCLQKMLGQRRGGVVSCHVTPLGEGKLVPRSLQQAFTQILLGIWPRHVTRAPIEGNLEEKRLLGIFWLFDGRQTPLTREGVGLTIE